MSTEPLERAIAATRRTLASVDDSQMDASTPCASWDVRTLVNHIVAGQHFFSSAVEKAAMPEGETDFAGGDYLAAFDAAAARTVAGFAREGAMDETFTLPFGEMPGSAFFGIALTDTFQHGWDLAKATGQSTDLDPELAAQILEQAQASIPDQFRGEEGAPFGPIQEPPANATKADELAAFLGRSC